MRKNHFRAMNRTMTIIFSFLLLSGIPGIVQAVDAAPAIRKIVEQEFPGATITEIRKETWKGNPGTEVEFIAKDGDEYEMFISENGEVLSIEEEKGLPWIGGELSLGAALSAEKSIYKGVDDEIQPVPYFRYENGPFEIKAEDTINATYTFLRTERFSLAAGGYLEMEPGYDPDDSDYLEGMDDLDNLFGASLQFKTWLAGWEVCLEVLQDLSGENDGQEVGLSLAYPYNVAGFELRPELSLTWLSEKTVDYFYGVSRKEARYDRRAYSPNSSYEIGLGLMVQRPIFGDFTAVGIIEATTFGDEIKDSPLVDEDFGLDAVIGVMYTF